MIRALLCALVLCACDADLDHYPAPDTTATADATHEDLGPCDPSTFLLMVPEHCRKDARP